MSLYTIAAASLTTRDDHRRRPAVDRGQVLRALALCLVVALAVVATRQSRAAGEPRASRLAAAMAAGG